jgi:hypothetical protein
MSWKNLRYRWFGVRWILIRPDTTDAKLRAAVNRALQEQSAVLFYSGPWMNTYHNALDKEKDTLRLVEFARGTQQNAYRVIIEPNGDVRTEPPTEDFDTELFRLCVRHGVDFAYMQRRPPIVTEETPPKPEGEPGNE